MKAYIRGISYYLPEQVLTNEELTKEFPEWDVDKVYNKVGVKERHIAAPDETAGDMAEKAARKQAIQNATKYAIEVPFKTIQRSFDVFEICAAMIEKGNPNSVTDAGVGVLCARAAVMGAYLNVKINASSLEDKVFADEMVSKAHAYVVKAQQLESELMKKVEEVIG